MQVLKEKQEMREWSREQRRKGKKIALVPTMGYLHEGHLSLVREAKRRADVVVVSIYVNPGQFAPHEDLASYPRDTEGDLKKLEPLGVNVVFNPHDLYVRDAPSASPGPPRGNGGGAGEGGGSSPESSLGGGGGGHETWVRVERLEKPLCGKDRPIFFRGVATVVAKLFNVVEPDVAVFGKKDYQQWRILERMVRDLDFGLEVVGVDLVREPSGLAMSSRNVRLTPDEHKQALSISQSLGAARDAVKEGERNVASLEEKVKARIEENGGAVDYAEVRDVETLERITELTKPAVFAVAARFGSVRLLDNVELFP